MSQASSDKQPPLSSRKSRYLQPTLEQINESYLDDELCNQESPKKVDPLKAIDNVGRIIGGLKQAILTRHESDQLAKEELESEFEKVMSALRNEFTHISGPGFKH